MKKYFLNGILIPISYIYFMGAGISATYFNWQYAKENSFMKWILLGQVIPTLKGVIWPYYASNYFFDFNKTTHKDNDKFRSEINAFKKSIELRNEAIRMLQVDSSPYITHTMNMTKENYNIFLELLYKSLEKSKLVSDKGLIYLDPNLQYHYRNEFQKGLSLYIEGIETKNMTNIGQAEKLWDEFGDWFNKFTKPTSNH